MITASRPTLWSVASIRIQRRVTVSGLKNVVFIHILLVNSLVDYHKPAISQRLQAANGGEPTRPERVRANATYTAQQLSSVINGNQVEAASRHHLPCIRNVGSGKRIVPRFDTDLPLPGLEDEVRHAAYHMIQEMITRNHEDNRLIRFNDISSGQCARRVPMRPAWVDVSESLEIMRSKQSMRSLIHRIGLDGILESIRITSKKWGPASFLDQHVGIGLFHCRKPSAEVGALTNTIANGEPLRHHDGESPYDALIKNIVAQNETHNIVKGVDASVGS